MKKPLIIPLLVLFCFPLILASCSKPLVDKELQFGIWASQKNLWDEAIFRWKKVLASNPNSAPAHNNLAVAYEKKGLWEDAKKEYEAALKIAPNDTSITSNYKKFKENLAPEKEKDKKEKNEKK
jgi:Tfp pilus assembly protein PilF